MSDRVPLPRYTGAVIYSCPDCYGDLEHEGADHYWCRACRRSHFFTQVMLQDETDYDRD